MACRCHPLSSNVERPYMDAPKYARLSVHDGLEVRLHPYIRTFVAALPLSLMGFAGRLLYRFFALQVLRTFWASPTTV